MKNTFPAQSLLKKGILLIFFCGLLASCISIETDITLKDNGSGVISLTYIVSDAFKAISSVGEEQKPLPLPIYKADFESLTLLNKGLVLKSHTVKETDKGSVVTAVLSFADMKSLSLVTGEEENSVVFTGNGNEKTFTLNLPFSENADYDNDSIEMIKTYCADDYFLYRITAPKPIKSLSRGQIKSDKTHAEFRIKITDLLLSKEKIAIEVRW